MHGAKARVIDFVLAKYLNNTDKHWISLKL